MLTNWIWRHGYPIYVNFTLLCNRKAQNRKAKKWWALTPLSAFAKETGIPAYKLADAALVETPQPRVYPAGDQAYLVSPHECYTFPEVYLAKLSNGIVYGGTNLVLVEDRVICHDLYDFKRDYTSEELHGRTLIDPKSMRIRWLLYDEAPELIPAAAAFVDACASNYAHWMTEVLPRVALFCAEERFHGVPIVVNDGLHKNIMESLLLVAGAEREIITLPIGRALTVRELFITSVAGYVPFERRTNTISDHSHGLFSPGAFDILRNSLLVLGQKTEESWPDKIFLPRYTGARKVTNTPELENLLLAQGYVSIEPEKLTFQQQIQLFNNAKKIVSPTGGSLANAIACKPGTQVAVLMSKHHDMIYRYWNNLLSPSGVRVSYVLGNIIKNHGHGIHGDFEIQVKYLDDLLKDFDKE